MWGAPIIPTDMWQRDQIPDPIMEDLAIQLNSVTPLPQEQSVKKAYILSAGIVDSDYNVGYQQLPVPNMIDIMHNHWEAPELLLDNNVPSFDKTLVYKQLGSTIIVPMRAPAINEGF